jgi:hypothetical protein
MPDAIELYTARYEREHGHKPQGKRFWRFILVSESVTAKDHALVLDQPMICPMAFCFWYRTRPSGVLRSRLPSAETGAARPQHVASALGLFSVQVVFRYCKIARNTDPLRGDFASNSDPS